MGILTTIKKQFVEIATVSDAIDTPTAAEKIKSNIWFKGPNVWILAFSIVIASVGLNVNSTAVIIGAMLISPLMGPIIGIGLSLGTNDGPLMKSAAKNLLVMVVISLAASCFYFLISPLELVNPTELEARTSPTIYDVLIALFGGLAGIVESCRKEKGTVLSGVAIATALMPPLCTAGYGLAKGNWHFLAGATFLFLINCVFIILATYVMVKYFHFKEAEYLDDSVRRKTKTIMSCIIILVVIPSIMSAVRVIGDNNFQASIQQFVNTNKFVGKSYIYDYKVHNGRGRKAEIFFAGNGLTEDDKTELYRSAEMLGIKKEQISILEQSMGGHREEADKLLAGIYERTDAQMEMMRTRIKELEAELEEQKKSEIDYAQIAKEIRFNYPEIGEISFGRGASVDDSLKVDECVNLIVKTKKSMKADEISKLENWAKMRLNHNSVHVSNITEK